MSANKYIGIDLGKTTIVSVVLNEDNEIEDSYTLDAGRSKEQIISIIDSIIKRYLEHYSNLIKGIGIASFGLVDINNGIVTSSGIIKDWRDIHLRSILEKKYGIPVYVDNDVKAALYGEYMSDPTYYGKSISYISVGTSIGIASYCNNKCLYGDNFKAGEIAKLTINNEKMTLGDIIGGRGISDQYYRLTGEHVSAKSIFCRAYTIPSDKIAKAIYSQMIEYLVKLIEIVGCVLDPKIIVLGGGVISSNALYNNILNTYEKLECSKYNMLSKSKMNDLAGAYGIARLSMNQGKWDLSI